MVSGYGHLTVCVCARAHECAREHVFARGHVCALVHVFLRVCICEGFLCLRLLFVCAFILLICSVVIGLCVYSFIWLLVGSLCACLN